MANALDPCAELTGGCYCGAVRYRLAAARRLGIYACHCTICQTRSGAGFQLGFFVKASDFSVEGPLIEGSYTLPNGDVATPVHCAQCLTRTHVLNPSRADFLAVRAGTLDESARILPDVHLWTRSKQPWITIPDGVPALETQADSFEEFVALFPKRPKPA